MPCDIELANAQLKLWDYKLLESVHTPIYSPNSSDAVQAVDTFTYSYFRLAPARHTVRLVLTHFVHPTDPWLLVQVTTKATSLKLSDVMNKTILIGSLAELKIINERIHRAGYFEEEIGMVEENCDRFKFDMDAEIFSIRNPAQFAAVFSIACFASLPCAQAEWTGCRQLMAKFQTCQPDIGLTV